MRKNSYYILIIVLTAVVVFGLWAYVRFFQKEEPKFLKFKVEKGAIHDVVKARGEVMPQKDFELSFPFSETVEEIFVAEGQSVREGSPLMRLRTKEYELELQRLEARLAQSSASYQKLLAGATPEDLNVSVIKVSNAKVAVDDAKKNLVDKIQDSATKADDAIYNKVDQFFTDSRSSRPHINFITNGKVEIGPIEERRIQMEYILGSLKLSVKNVTAASGDLGILAGKVRKDLGETRSFLDDAAMAVNSAVPAGSVTQTTIDSWKSDVATGRTNINTAIINMTTAEEKLATAESDLALTERELALKTARARAEDITIAKAQIEEIESQVAAAQEKIKKAILLAPSSAQIVKIWLEKGEFFNVGQTAVSLDAQGYKIQSDISELDIGRITEDNGNDVVVALDAFSGQKLYGKIISVEPKEVVKEGDIFYKVNVYLEQSSLKIRPGMSADLDILVADKNDALKIPAFAVEESDGKKFIIVLKNGKPTRKEIKTGLSDGEVVEVVDGLVEGEEIIVPTE